MKQALVHCGERIACAAAPDGGLSDHPQSDHPPSPHACNHARNPQSKIRLVHCIGSMRVGGAEGQLAELICRLPRDRFEQSLVLLRGEGALVARVRESGCEVIDLGLLRRSGNSTLGWLRSLAGVFFRYHRFLRRSRPQILHAQLPLTNLFSVLVGRLAAVPVIVTSQLQLSNFKRGRPLLRGLDNWANRHATAVWVNSEAVRRDMIEHDGIDPARLHRIYNGVALQQFKPLDRASVRGALGLAPGDLVLIVVANLHPYKGHDDLLRAVALLLPQFPNLRLLLAGRDQGTGERLKALAGELNLGPAAQFLGERHDVPDLLAAADIAVHPSHEEGFSNSILEAMTAGRPLVVTEVGGNSEQVAEGVNGFLTPPRDPAALAAALEKLLGNPELRSRMGAVSRSRIEREFSMERNVAETAAFYEALLKG